MGVGWGRLVLYLVLCLAMCLYNSHLWSVCLAIKVWVRYLLYKKEKQISGLTLHLIVATKLLALPLLSHVLPVCLFLCPNLPPLVKKVVIGLGSSLVPNAIWPQFNLIPSTETLFPNKITFMILGIGASTCLLGIQSSTQLIIVIKEKMASALQGHYTNKTKSIVFIATDYNIRNQKGFQ